MTARRPLLPGVGLYVHIPFCRIRCHYCDFACYPGIEDRMGDYVSAVGSEWTRYPALEVASLFVGGGTPSLLEADHVTRLGTALRSHGHWPDGLEATFEVNPGTGGPAEWAAWREQGFNRVSMGVQVMDDAMLRAIGRDHDVAAVRRTWADLAAAGFEDVSMDLIYGLPGQSPADWGDTLDRILDMGPPHLSLYSLQVEERTLFGVRHAQGRLEVPDEDRVREMHDMAVERLARAGLVRYEIASWCRPGHESAHNRLYWTHRDFVGLGTGAHSWFEGRRYAHDRSIRGYMADPAPRWDVDPEGHDLSLDTALIMGLRMVDEGVDVARLARRFGEDPRLVHGPAFDRLEREGLLTWQGDVVRLAPEAIPLANVVFEALLRSA